MFGKMRQKSKDHHCGAVMAKAVIGSFSRVSKAGIAPIGRAERQHTPLPWQTVKFADLSRNSGFVIVRAHLGQGKI